MKTRSFIRCGSRGALRWTCLWFASLLFATGCGVGDDPPDPSPLESASSEELGAQSGLVLLEEEPLNTFIEEYVQIDRIDPDANDVGDANLTINDSIETPNFNFPACSSGTCTYIDWETLCEDPANHLLIDEAGDVDSSSFPRKIECVASSQVLSKMDLTWVSAANNTEYAYFGVQRRNNNGDAAYYWVFTQEEPNTDPTSSSSIDKCKAGEYFLEYDIVPGDVLITGQFHPSTGAAVVVYTAIDTRFNYPASMTIDYNDSTLWSLSTLPGIVGAVNTTNMMPVTCPSDFVAPQAFDGAELEPEIFAEAALPVELFTGTGSICGASFWGSVITRPSGSGGTSPDFKDLAGPRIFNFGNLEIEPVISNTCIPGVFDVEFTKFVAPGGADPADATCTWTLTPKGEGECPSSATEGVIEVSQGCDASQVDVSGEPEFAAGSYCVSVEAVIDFAGDVCNDAADAGQIDLFEELVAEAEISATCGPLVFNYELTSLTGDDDGTAVCTWSTRQLLSGDADCSQASGDPIALAGGCEGPNISDGDISEPGAYCVYVDVEVTIGTNICTTDATAGPADVWDAIVITLPTAEGDCENNLTVSASVSGGSGDWTYEWVCDGPGEPDLITDNLTHTFTGVPPGRYFCTLTVDDNRVLPATASPGEACQVVSPPTDDIVASPLHVDLDVSSGPAICTPGVLFDDSASYVADPSGGSVSPAYAYSWSGSGAVFCDSASMCMLMPADNMCPSYDLQVTLTDTSLPEGFCDAAVSETETYSKEIKILVSDNP